MHTSRTKCFDGIYEHLGYAAHKI